MSTDQDNRGQSCRMFGRGRQGLRASSNLAKGRHGVGLDAASPGLSEVRCRSDSGCALTIGGDSRPADQASN